MTTGRPGVRPLRFTGGIAEFAEQQGIAGAFRAALLAPPALDEIVDRRHGSPPKGRQRGGGRAAKWEKYARCRELKGEEASPLLVSPPVYPICPDARRLLSAASCAAEDGLDDHAPRSHPQFLDRRPYRPWEVDARRPADPDDGRARGAGDEGAGARFHGDRTRAWHHHQGADRPPQLQGQGWSRLRLEPHRHPRPCRLRL